MLIVQLLHCFGPSNVGYIYISISIYSKIKNQIFVENSILAFVPFNVNAILSLFCIRLGLSQPHRKAQSSQAV